MIILAKADGMQVIKENNPTGAGTRFHTQYRVAPINPGTDSRERIFIRKTEAMRYFKACTAENCVPSNTLWESQKVDSLIVRSIYDL